MDKSGGRKTGVAIGWSLRPGTAPAPSVTVAAAQVVDSSALLPELPGLTTSSDKARRLLAGGETEIWPEKSWGRLTAGGYHVALETPASAPLFWRRSRRRLGSDLDVDWAMRKSGGPPSSRKAWRKQAIGATEMGRFMSTRKVPNASGEPSMPCAIAHTLRQLAMDDEREIVALIRRPYAGAKPRSAQRNQYRRRWARLRC